MGARLGRIHEGLSRGAVFVPDGRLLDVGCGNGDYLARAEMRGMRAFGLEPNIHGFLICKSRGLNVKNAFLEDSGYPQDFFDIITVNHVLEHVPDPLSSLLLIKSLLKPNGIAIIQVPNISSLAFYASREHFLHLDVPRHLFHFEKNTLSAYLDKAGLRLLRVRYYTSAMALLESLFLRTRGSRPISANNKDVARRGAVLSPFIEILFTPFKILLNNLELGDVFEVYATKV